jgi:ferritin
MSLDEEDWATWNFMQWFVKEQIEEETLAMNLMNKMKIAGGEKANHNDLYSLDRDLLQTSDDVRSAQDVTAENP